jgi:hypothetical protein
LPQAPAVVFRHNGAAVSLVHLVNKPKAGQHLVNTWSTNHNLVPRLYFDTMVPP